MCIFIFFRLLVCNSSIKVFYQTESPHIRILRISMTVFRSTCDDVDFGVPKFWSPTGAKRHVHDATYSIARTKRLRAPIMSKRGADDECHARAVVAKRQDVRLTDECEPSALLCPITHEMFRDPVVVVASGHTYERSAILRHFSFRNTDPCTNGIVHDKMVVQNVQTRKSVQDWLSANPSRTPNGWNSRDIPTPGFGYALDDEDAKILKTIRHHCSLFDWWTDGQHPAEWRGVRVESRRVVSLDLSGMKIDSLPDSVGDLGALQVLDLSSNYLTCVPNSIGNLVSLDVFDVRYNFLTGIPESIGKLASLRVLSLDNNKIARLPPTIGNLASLERLDFDRNRLIDVPESIGNLAKLKRLSGDKNQLANIPSSIGKLASLDALCLSCNNLIGLPESVGSLASLKSLDLDNNGVSDLPESIGNLKNLEKLTVCGNELKQLPETIQGLCSLRFLCACDNKLRRLPASLGRLSLLQRMFLPNNELTRIPASIGDLAALKQIDLRGNTLVRLPQSLSRLKELEELRLMDTRLCRECVPEALRSVTKFF